MVAQPSSVEALTEPSWCCPSPVLLDGKEGLRCSVPERGTVAGGPQTSVTGGDEMPEENPGLLRKANFGGPIGGSGAFRAERSPWETTS